LQEVPSENNLAGLTIPLSLPLNKGLFLTASKLPTEDLSLLGASFRYSDAKGKYYLTGINTLNKADIDVQGQNQLNLTTAPAKGVLANMQLGGLIALNDLSGYSQERSVILKRNIANIGDGVTFNDFMVPLNSNDMDIKENSFSFVYEDNPKKAAPEPDLLYSKIGKYSRYMNPDTGEYISIYYSVWDVYTAGDIRDYRLPLLPSDEEVGGDVPPCLITNMAYYWEPQVISLSLDSTFDFNTFQFATWYQYATHSSSNSQAFYANF